MPAERTTMRQVREVLRLKFAGVPTREIARRIGVAASTARATISGGRPELALARRDDRRGAGDAALHAGRHEAGTPVSGGRSPTGRRSIANSSASTSRCRSCGTSTSSAIPTAIAIPGSANSTAPGRTSSRSRCVKNACGGRQAVRRLRRRHGPGDHRPADRRDASGADLCGRPWRLELHLR